MKVARQLYTNNKVFICMAADGYFGHINIQIISVSRTRGHRLVNQGLFRLIDDKIGLKAPLNSNQPTI